jgi:hypothetical protein
MEDWKKNNTNLAMVQAGSADVDRAGFGIGAKTGFGTFHSYESLRKAMMTHSTEHLSAWDDFLGATLSTKWAVAVSASTTASISAQAREGKLTLSADATINHFADVALGLHFLVSNGYTFFETRIKNTSVITARILEVGFNDALAPAAGLAFSNHATPTAVSTNAAIFGYSSAENALWKINTVKASTAATKVITGAPSTSYQKLGVIIDPTGDAHFFIDGVNVGDVVGAVATTSLLTPWIALKTTAGTAAVVDVDYIFVGGTR